MPLFESISLIFLGSVMICIAFDVLGVLVDWIGRFRKGKT